MTFGTSTSLDLGQASQHLWHWFTWYHIFSCFVCTRRVCFLLSWQI